MPKFSNSRECSDTMFYRWIFTTQVTGQEDNNGCSLSDAECAAQGRVFDQLPCQCVCPPCQGMAIQNESTCDCQCPTPMEECTLPQEFNDNTCQCECPIVQACENPLHEFNMQICTCTCPTVEECIGGNRFNRDTCQCECPLTPSVCTDEQFLNDTECMCQCNEVPTCPPGTFFNSTICQCRCQTILPCISPLEFDDRLSACNCSCPQQQTCNGACP